MIEIEFRGEKYSLYFNGEALFNAYAKFGSDQNLFDRIGSMDKEGFHATLWMLCELSAQGELYRRMMGYDRKKYLDYARTLVQVQPHELPALRQAVMDAMKEGFVQKHPDRKGYDPWLAELEAQKKKKFSRNLSISRLLHRDSACPYEKE